MSCTHWPDPDLAVAAVVRRARLEAGLTCAEAAERAGLSPLTLGRLEEGDGNALLFADGLALAHSLGITFPTLARRIEHACGRSGGPSDPGDPRPTGPGGGTDRPGSEPVSRQGVASVI